MAKNNIASSDTLAAKFNTLRTGIKSGLMEYLGKPLYNILETKEIRQDMPFGIRSKYDFRDKSLSLRKQDIFKGWDAELKAKKKNLMFELSK